MSADLPDLAALRALEAAATPGPWEVLGDHLVWPSEKGPAANDPILAVVSEAHDAAETARFIAAMRNALPALLDAAEEADWERVGHRAWVRRDAPDTLRAERDAARAEVAALRDGIERLCDVPFDCMTANADGEHQAVPVEHLRALLTPGADQ